MSEAPSSLIKSKPQAPGFGGGALKPTIIAAIADTLIWSYILLISYKIIYEKLIMNVRYPVFNWMQPTYALIFGAIIAMLFFFTKISIGRAAQGLYKEDPNALLFKQPYTIFGYIVIIITFVAGLHITQFSISEFFSSAGLNGARRIFSALLNPDFTIFQDGLFAAIETIFMAFIATAISLPFAFLLSFFASRNLMESSRVGMTAYVVIRFFLNVSRSIEPLIWAIIFSVWVGIGPFSGMLALALHSVSSLAKLYSEQIENISEGPLEAITATGAHPIQVVWFGVVPQIVLPFLSFTIYRWDINVRMATVIGLVGGGGIGTQLMQYQGMAKWNQVGMLVIIIAIIVWVMDWSSSRIREAIK